MTNPIKRICENTNRFTISAAIFSAGILAIALNVQAVPSAVPMPIYGPSQAESYAIQIAPKLEEFVTQQERRHEIACGAMLIHGEARGESETGKRAVIENALNRVDSQYYPGTLCSVIFQRAQYSFIGDENWSRVNNDFSVRPILPSVKSAIDITRAAIERPREERIVKGLHYLATDANPHWRSTMPKRGAITIGGHIHFNSKRP